MRVLWGLLALASTASAFAPIVHKTLKQHRHHQASTSQLFASTAASSSSLAGNEQEFSSPLDPLINQLPWNARRQKERAARRMRREVAQLHRDLGIPEDAPYEQVVAAADKAILQAGRDAKKRLAVEKSKDKILQLRLNERLAGLTSVNMEARSQSTHERDGPMEVKKKKPDKTNTPAWAEGIVVKPDAKWRNRQIGIYGTMSTVGVLLPPTIGKMLMVQLLIVIGQLIWRGVPTEGGGYNLFGNSDGGGSHKKVAWVLGCSIFLTGKLLVFALMPSVLRGYKWTEIIGFVAENLIYMTANMFLQPYKGK